MNKSDKISECYDLSKRLCNACVANNIKTRGELIDIYNKYGYRGMNENFEGFGPKSVCEIREMIDKFESSNSKSDVEDNIGDQSPIPDIKAVIDSMIDFNERCGSCKSIVRTESLDHPDWVVELSVKKKGTKPDDEMPDFNQIIRLIDEWKELSSEQLKRYENIYDFLEERYQHTED